jgi:hypothetical protein
MKNKRIYNIVKSAINDMDCYALLASGAPKDEFMPEIKTVYDALHEDDSIEAITNLLSATFNQAFFPDNFSPESFIGCAKKIREQLDEARKSTMKLVDEYAQVDTDFWNVAHELDYYKKGTAEYYKTESDFEYLSEKRDSLEDRVIKAAKDEGLFSRSKKGTKKQLEAFMCKYGYHGEGGWWMKEE